MFADEYIFQFSTKKNYLLFIITFSIFLGSRLGNRLMIIFGVTMLSVFIIARICSARLFNRINIDREHYPRCFEGNSLEVELSLRTDSAFPIFMLEVIDTFPPGNEYRIHNLIPYKFDRKNHFSVQYRDVCTRHRGLYVLGPIYLKASDPLGIFSQTIEGKIFTNLLVYPQALDLQSFKVLWRGTLFHVGLETLLKSGKSEEFIGLRDYQRGDNLNMIHWRSSAKHQKLLVKDFRENVQTDVAVFLDLFRLSHSGLGDITTTEYIIKAGATVARASVELGHFVEIFGLGENLEHITSGGGINHIINILDRLTFFKAKGEGSFEEQFTKSSALCKHGSTVVLIAAATNFTHSNIKDTLRKLIGRNIYVIVILINDRTFIKIWKEQEVTHSKAAPIEEIAKLLILEGCAVYIIGKDDELDKKLDEKADNLEILSRRFI